MNHKGNITVKLSTEVIANYTDQRDMSRYVHMAIFTDDKLSDILIVKLDD